MRLIVFEGCLGADAKINKLNNERWLVNFNLADTDMWVDDKGVQQKNTTWASCTYGLPAKTAEKLAPHLTKGKCITVTGKPHSSCYSAMVNDKKEWRGVLNINVSDLNFPPVKQGGSDSNSNADGSHNNGVKPRSQAAPAQDQSLDEKWNSMGGAGDTAPNHAFDDAPWATTPPPAF